MNTAKPMSATGLGVPAGPWRWAALGFVLLALAAAGLTIAAPQVAGLAGYALLLGIALLAGLFLYAVWPRSGRAAEDAMRVAEAAAKANIAWAVTGEGGAVLDCNPVYRRMAGTNETAPPPPPVAEVRTPEPDKSAAPPPVAPAASQNASDLFRDAPMGVAFADAS